jgi:DNA-binding protein
VGPDPAARGSQVAQAVEFVRALRERLLKMTRQLAWI